MGSGADAMLKTVASHKKGDAKKLVKSYKPNMKMTRKKTPIKKMKHTMSRKKTLKNPPNKKLL